MKMHRLRKENGEIDKRPPIMTLQMIEQEKEAEEHQIIKVHEEELTRRLIVPRSLNNVKENRIFTQKYKCYSPSQVKRYW